MKLFLFSKSHFKSVHVTHRLFLQLVTYPRFCGFIFVPRSKSVPPCSLQELSYLLFPLFFISCSKLRKRKVDGGTLLSLPHLLSSDFSGGKFMARKHFWQPHYVLPLTPANCPGDQLRVLISTHSQFITGGNLWESVWRINKILWA